MKWWNLFLIYVFYHYFIVSVFFTRGTFAWFLLKLKLNVGYVCQENFLLSSFFCWKCLLSDRVAYCFESLEKRRVIYDKRATIMEKIFMYHFCTVMLSVTNKSLRCLPKIKIKRRVLLSQVQSNQLPYSPHFKGVQKP